MTREEAIMWIKTLQEDAIFEVNEALLLAIEALSADTVSREEAIQAIDKCRERKNKEIEQLREFYSQKPTIPMFKEAEEAYKAWTGEEMGNTSDEINEMNNEIIKDILKMMPTAYLLEALGVSTFEELTEQADRPTDGVYVKGLELPSNCYECVLNNDVMCCRGHETLQHDLISHDRTTRPNWCPLREIHDADRPHGEWIVVAYQKDGEEYIHSCTCSECGSKSALRTNFCGYCGADMRGGAE